MFYLDQLNLQSLLVQLYSLIFNNSSLLNPFVCLFLNLFSKLKPSLRTTIIIKKVRLLYYIYLNLYCLNFSFTKNTTCVIQPRKSTITYQMWESDQQVDLGAAEKSEPAQSPQFFVSKPQAGARQLGHTDLSCPRRVPHLTTALSHLNNVTNCPIRNSLIA